MANALLMKLLAWSSLTASNTATNYSATNLGVDRMGPSWRSNSGASSRTLTVDMGADVAIDTIALFGIAGAGTPPDGAWQWKVDLATAAQGGFGGSFWAGSTETLLAGTALPVSGKGKALWQAPAGAPAAARHVRITLSSLGSAAIQASRLCIGTKIQPTRNFSYGAAYGVRPLGSLDFSPRGVLMRRAGAKLRGVGLTFNHVYRDELEERMQRLFEEVGNDRPLVLVTDPDAHAQRQNRMYFGFLNGNLGSVHRRPGGFSCDVNLVALD